MVNHLKKKLKVSCPLYSLKSLCCRLKIEKTHNFRVRNFISECLQEANSNNYISLCT